MGSRSLSYYWPSYVKLLRHFRNGPSLSWHHYQRSDCECAVFWDGHRFVESAGRKGLPDTVVEIWGAEVYTTGGFYQPTNGDVIVDVGANIGAFSVWAARQAPGARILAFEPFEENYSVLTRNLTGWKHNVASYCAAVGAAAGTGAMVDGGSRSVDHRLVVDAPAAGGPTVPIVSLDQALNLSQSARIDLLKMDVEGSEYDIFSSVTAETLGRCRHVSLEYHDHLRPGTLALIQARLEPTHSIAAIDASSEGYGIIRARLRDD